MPADSPENKKEARQACVAQSVAARGNSAVCLPCSSCGMTHPVSLRCPVPLPGEGEWKCTGWDGHEPTYERVEATAKPSAAPTNQGVNQTEGEGELRARIEELERRATEFSAWLSFVAGQGKAAEIKEAFRSDTGFGPYILSDEEFMRREEVARAAVPKEEA